METSSEAVSEDGKVSMGRRMSVSIDGRRQVLAGDPDQQQGGSDTRTPRSGEDEKDTGAVLSRLTEAVVSLTNEYKTRDEKNQGDQKKNRFWVKFGAWVVFVYTTITAFQWCTLLESNRINRKSFEETQRAAVYLGRPDGEIGEFMPGKDILRIVLYFRNAGGTAAQRTVIDTWPITTTLGGPSVELKFQPPDHHYIGPDIPPGVPYNTYIPYRDATQEELDSGKKDLVIYGRVTYSDSFGSHCETFAVAYDGNPLRRFGLTVDVYSRMFPDICDYK
jgi:hypothetical protein